jgi:hypothetical protein
VYQRQMGVVEQCLLPLRMTFTEEDDDK